MARHVIRPAIEVGRTDRLMGLLGILGRALIDSRRPRNVFVAEGRSDQRPGLLRRFLAQLYAVGSHIGNETDGFAADIDALIELLRSAHRLGGAESELARGFLLQGR